MKMARGAFPYLVSTLLAVAAGIFATLNGPFGVAVDSAGRILIADEMNHRIRVVTPDGRIATIAGTGVGGSAGISGPATVAQLAYPVSVAVDSYDNLFISDLGNHRVVRVFRYGAALTGAQ
jgi:DNA-binding beta-propeller fold protein YncE